MLGVLLGLRNRCARSKTYPPPLAAPNHRANLQCVALHLLQCLLHAQPVSLCSQELRCSHTPLIRTARCMRRLQRALRLLLTHPVGRKRGMQIMGVPDYEQEQRQLPCLGSPYMRTPASRNGCAALAGITAEAHCPHAPVHGALRCLVGWRARQARALAADRHVRHAQLLMQTCVLEIAAAVLVARAPLLLLNSQLRLALRLGRRRFLRLLRKAMRLQGRRAGQPMSAHDTQLCGIVLAARAP